MLLLLLFMRFAAHLLPASSTLPIRSPPTTLGPSTFLDSSCFAAVNIEQERRNTRETINSLYHLRPQGCGGPGWTRAYYLNMFNPESRCPSNWVLHETPVRSCGRTSSTSFRCDSVDVLVNGREYSAICGRIRAYQRGYSNGFFYNVRAILRNSSDRYTIEDPYVSGLSLTHGRPGRSKHIWTFAGAVDEASIRTETAFSCPCIDTTFAWPGLPPFIHNDYFCDTGAATFNYDGAELYKEDPLWEGEGCGASSTCCSFNNPPWFYKKLNYSTSDDLELRLCCTLGPHLEDKLIDLIELYVQ